MAVCVIFAFILHDYAVIDHDVPFAQMFFRCFWLPTYAVIPMITMRSFSEGYKNGTMDSIFSTPVACWDVVLAEFFSAYAMFVALWMCSLLPFAVVKFGAWQIFCDAAFASKFNIIGGVAFVCLVGTFFVAVGVLASSLTENQVIACMVTFFILMAVLIGGVFLASSQKMANLTPFSTYHESLSIFSQLDNFCSGVVDSRVIVFYISSCILSLCLATVAVHRKIG
jgi:ABC-2 type transport system permease protein